MKSRYGLLGISAFLVLLLASQTMTTAPATPPEDPQPRAWQPIQLAINQGLPKTAIDEIDKQLPGAISRGDNDFLVRLLATRAILDGQLQGRDEIHRIVRLQKDLETAPQETRPVIRAILANWFWGYYSQNQWRFRNRTEVDPGVLESEEPVIIKSADDLSTWTRERIIAQSAALFEAALDSGDGSEKVLRDTAIDDYDDLLVRGNAPDAYRPTLYDFVVADAIDFYDDAAETYAGPAERFELTADTPVFETLDRFLEWDVSDADAKSPLRRATTLYQDWLSFHRDDADPSALIDTDLHRIEFAKKHASGKGTDAAFEEALKAFVSKNSQHEISTRAQFRLALIARENDEPARAREIAKQAVDAHPDSVGAKACAAMIRQIEAPSVAIATEEIWNPQLDGNAHPKIQVTYRNVTKVYFRLVKLDYEAIRKSGRRPENLTEVARQMLTKRTPVLAWSESLDATDDYRDRVEQVAARSDVPRGAYYLIASTSDDFPMNEGFTAITDVWVSGLSMVIESRYDEGLLVGYVLDSLTGEPLADVDVDVWATLNRRSGGTSGPASRAKLQTDQEGRFEYSGVANYNITFLAETEDDRLWSQEYHINRRNNRKQNDVTRSHFFTDRALYRPGQVVRYKIICTRSNQDDSEYAVSPEESIEVELLDANGKVVERASHRCNELGSCHGSFNLPTGGLTGVMTIRTTGAFRGAQSIRVEEYKRPKFEVKVDSPESSVRLGEDVTVKGKATAYTGAAIDGATVRYRVVRETELPPWWWYRCWWMPPSPMPPQTIAEGETETDELGHFAVSFPAIPDNSVDRESEPKFRFKVEAAVVDTTGETREGTTTVLVGYTSMEATLSTENPDWLTDEEPVAVNVSTRTLQGMPVSTKVTLKVQSLKKPEFVGQRRIGNPVPYRVFGSVRSDGEDQIKPEEPNSWPVEETIETIEVSTDDSGTATVDVDIDAGHYRVTLAAVDATGEDVSAVLPLRVIDPDSNECELMIADLFAVKNARVEPGDTFRAVWGSGYESARAFVEIAHRGETLQQFWTPEGQTQSQISLDVTEELRGGFTLRVWMVRENRFYLNERRIDVPWTNKELTVRWERFLSKLKPGQRETWTAVIEDASGDTESSMKKAVEMVATLYDASLDAFAPHRFQDGFGLFYQDHSRIAVTDQNRWEGLQRISVYRSIGMPSVELQYRSYPRELQSSVMVAFAAMRSERAFGGRMMRKGIAAEGMPMPAAAPMAMADAAMESDAMVAGDMLENSAQPPSSDDGEGVDLSDVSPRKNLNETAFFFPELTADEDGKVTMNFTMPEALTRWQLLGFAHAADLSAGVIRDTAVTSKDLMVQPNPPRVLREGDEIELTVKVSNQSATVQRGTVALEFTDARTGDSVDKAIGNSQSRHEFEIPAGQSKSFAWPIRVPDGMGFLVYKAVASTGRLSDGEEGYLPVLSRKILVHESIALPIDGSETKTFTLDKLASLDSDSIRSESLTVQMTSNPAWYAVMALPYLMDYPHECSEQTFNRLYANLLARHIATSDPKIERVFQQWRNQPRAIKGQPGGRDPLESPLQQNEELASIALTETPWLVEAESEAEARRNVGILFDQNRVTDQVTRLARRLNDMQLEDGSWPWFPGGRSNSFITLYLATGYGRLRHLGADVDVSPAIKSLSHLDAYSKKVYSEIKKKDRKTRHLSSTIAMYLYGRSFFLQDVDVSTDAKPALNYWLDQASEHWIELPRMSQAHLAIALTRFGRKDDAMAIVASLKERSVTNDLGMHWNDGVRGWFWYQADIETQAMMIEMFDEVASDQSSVESCKAWLLRQKETRAWETTKATADAVYSLLLRGADLLADQTLVDVKVGQRDVQQQNVEAGTGFYQQRFEANEITPEMGSITVTKTTPGIAWGGVHWKYFQNVEDVTPHEGTPLEIQKQLFVVRSTPTGEILRPVVDGRVVSGSQADKVDVDGTPIRVGDELVSRLIVRSSRAMEFVHLKDSRGSGTEPSNVLSGYRWQDGLGYYQSTRDAAEHFFIDYLPKGTYVLESRSRVQLRGRYQSGLATIESMYAPQYNSHSESHAMTVGD